MVRTARIGNGTCGEALIRRRKLVAALAGSQANPAPAIGPGVSAFSGPSERRTKEPDSATYYSKRRGLDAASRAPALIAGGLIVTAAGVADAAGPVVADPVGPDGV